LTFEQAASAYIKAHQSGWKNVKHGQQWRNTLEQYAYPIIGKMLVADVDTPQIIRILEPIWQKKAETAVRLRNRIELVLDWATARKYREGLNPARWRGHLDKLLARQSKTRRKHHAALPVDQAGAFMKRLRASEGMGARALEFVILTACRSGEVRGAKWGEIDLDAGVWVVPPERMKAAKEHRVPLSDAAVELLKNLPRFATSEFVFPAPRGGMLSDMTLNQLMRRMKVDAVPHGFRSTFRDWCADYTNYPREVAEMALAHAIESKVEAAYRRGDLFEKRRRLMAEWSQFLANPMMKGEVIPLRSETA